MYMLLLFTIKLHKCCPAQDIIIRPDSDKWQLQTPQFWQVKHTPREQGNGDKSLGELNKDHQNPKAIAPYHGGCGTTKNMFIVQRVYSYGLQNLYPPQIF
jgi:hypothetical protein